MVPTVHCGIKAEVSWFLMDLSRLAINKFSFDLSLFSCKGVQKIKDFLDRMLLENIQFLGRKLCAQVFSFFVFVNIIIIFSDSLLLKLNSHMPNEFNENTAMKNDSMITWKKSKACYDAISSLNTKINVFCKTRQQR